jgi:beta-galactosidase
MVYIANYWNDDKQKTVKVYSNCDEVELKLNGKVMVKQKPDTDSYSKKLLHPPFTFYLSDYQAGKLTATGYIKGHPAASQSVSTSGKAYRIKLTADLSGKPLASGKNDVIFVYATITDQQGNAVPEAANMINLKVQGVASIVGPSAIKAEAGIAALLLKASEKPGAIKIRASADGLKSSELILQSK